MRAHLLRSLCHSRIESLTCVNLPSLDGPGSYEQDGYGRGQKRGTPRRERDDKVHDSIIEDRIQRERPCRTLFIRNIKASHMLLPSFGEASSTFV